VSLTDHALEGGFPSRETPTHCHAKPVGVKDLVGRAPGEPEGQAIRIFTVDYELDSVGSDAKQSCCCALEVDDELAARTVDGEAFSPPVVQGAKGALLPLGLQRLLQTIPSLVEGTTEKFNRPLMMVDLPMLIPGEAFNSRLDEVAVDAGEPFNEELVARVRVLR
jgi:hypothetical protein